MPLPRLKKQCKAKCKRTGVRCLNPAVNGFDVCRFHGANPNSGAGAPKGNRNAMKHGATMNKFLNDEEKQRYREYLANLKTEFGDAENSVVDRSLYEQLAMIYIRIDRAADGDAVSGTIDDLTKIFNRVLSKIESRRKVSSESDPQKLMRELLNRLGPLAPQQIEDAEFTVEPPKKLPAGKRRKSRRTSRKSTESPVKSENKSEDQTDRTKGQDDGIFD